jgi:(p)ppGpp synthase/HD superfamily hydrolase
MPQADPLVPRERTIVDKAIPIAVIAHAGQKDKAGMPYVFHPLRVMELVRLAGGDDIAQAVAVLHDVMEDSDAFWSETGYMLGALGGHDPEFRDRVDRIYEEHGREAPSAKPKQVEALVRRMMHQDGLIYYHAYVEEIATDPRLALVKWADSTDNWARLGDVSAEDRRRLAKKYEKNFILLNEEPWQAAIRSRHLGQMITRIPGKTA